MGQPIQTTVDTVAHAANTVIDQGVLGALVILLLAIVIGLVWLHLRLRNKFMAYLERQSNK